MKILKVMQVGDVSEYTKDLTPRYQTSGSSGLDLYAKHRSDIYPGERQLIKTGVAIELPVGYEGQVRGRSGLSANRGLFCIHGTIDSDYRGEIAVLLYNSTRVTHTIKAGDRIAQLVITPYEKVEVVKAEQLSSTERGVGGFGSTGER